MPWFTHRQAEVTFIHVFCFAAEPPPDPATCQPVPNHDTVLEINSANEILGVVLLGGSDTLINVSYCRDTPKPVTHTMKNSLDLKTLLWTYQYFELSNAF